MHKEHLSILTRFWLLLKPDIKEIKNVYVLAVFAGILSLALPLGIQSVVNFIQAGQVSTSWILLVFLVVASIVFSGVMTITQLRITEKLQQRIFVRAAFEFSDRIPKIKMMELIKRYAPELTNRFFDTVSIQKGLSKLLVDFSSASIQIFFGLVLLSFYHPFFILYGLFLTVLVFLIFKLTATRGYKSSLRESNYKYKIAHWLEELAYARFSFKMAGNPELALDRTNKYLNEYLRSRNVHFRVLVQQYSMLIAFKAFVALGLLVIGGWLVLNQTLNIGQFVASEIIILMVLSSVEKVILNLEDIFDVLTAIEKISQVTDLPLEQNHHEAMIHNTTKEGYDLKINNLTFKTELLCHPIIENITLSVNSNEILGIRYDSSISSNVLFNLIFGIYELQSGVIAINSNSMNKMNRMELRNNIGNLMFQDRLINSSVEENISLGRSYVSPKEVQNISEKLILSDYISSFTDGFDTLINPEAHFIPKDVIQKILLARALVGKPKLLLIENPIDSIQENHVDEVLNTLKNQSNCTILLASNNPKVLNICNRVVEFRKGQLLS